MMTIKLFIYLCVPLVFASIQSAGPRFRRASVGRALKKSKKGSKSSGLGDISDLILNGFNASPGTKSEKSGKSKSKSPKSCKSSKSKKSSKCEEATTVSPAPTVLATASPTSTPTASPTNSPTRTPTRSPTFFPTVSPQPTTTCSSKSKKCKSKTKKSKSKSTKTSKKSGKKRIGPLPAPSPSILTAIPTSIIRKGARTHAPVIEVPTPNEPVILADAVLPPEYLSTEAPVLDALPRNGPQHDPFGGLSENEKEVKAETVKIAEKWVVEILEEEIEQLQLTVNENEDIHNSQGIETGSSPGLSETEEEVKVEAEKTAEEWVEILEEENGTNSEGEEELNETPREKDAIEVLWPSESPTSAPTQFFPVKVVDATAFTILYMLSSSSPTPTAQDMEEAIWVTLDYLDDFFEFQFRDSETEYKILGGVHAVSHSETHIRFEVAAEFYLSSIYIPDSAELDELIQHAFAEPNLEILLNELRDLPKTNPFSSIESLHAAQDDPATPDVDESSSLPGRIALGVSAILGVAVISGISIYSRHWRNSSPTPKGTDTSTVSGDDMRILEDDDEEESEIKFIYSDEDLGDDDSLFQSPFLFDQHRKDDV